MQTADKTAADLAAACGVTVQAVYKWLKDPAMNLKNEHLFAIADRLGFEARWIATGKGPERNRLDESEKTLLECYRAAREPEKTAIHQVAETLAHAYIGKIDDDQGFC